MTQRRRFRRRLRTTVLALVACGALFWGAVDIVGVPAQRLWLQLGWVALGVLLLMGCASVLAWGWFRLRHRK